MFVGDEIAPYKQSAVEAVEALGSQLIITGSPKQPTTQNSKKRELEG
jgi:hypothetical protein